MGPHFLIEEITSEAQMKEQKTEQKCAEDGRIRKGA